MNVTELKDFFKSGQMYDLMSSMGAEHDSMFLQKFPTLSFHLYNNFPPHMK